MELAKAFETLWPYLIAGAIPFLIWFVRLEGKVIAQSREIDLLKDAFKEHRETAKENTDKLWQAMNEIRTAMTTVIQSTSRIEGQLKTKE